MKNNTPFKFFLRFWIALSSIVAFVISWIVLGHTGKPVAGNSISVDPSGTSQNASQGSSQLAPLPTLAPIPSFDGSVLQSQPQQFSQPNTQFSQPNFNFTPRFRTRGS